MSSKLLYLSYLCYRKLSAKVKLAALKHTKAINLIISRQSFTAILMLVLRLRRQLIFLSADIRLNFIIASFTLLCRMLTGAKHWTPLTWLSSTFIFCCVPTTTNWTTALLQRQTWRKRLLTDRSKWRPGRISDTSIAVTRAHIC